MSKQLTLCQQIEYHLALVQVITGNDNRRRLYAVSLLPLTAAVGAMWPVSEWVLNSVSGLSMLTNDLAVCFVGRLLNIGMKVFGV